MKEKKYWVMNWKVLESKTDQKNEHVKKQMNIKGNKRKISKWMNKQRRKNREKKLIVSCGEKESMNEDANRKHKM